VHEERALDLSQMRFTACNFIEAKIESSLLMHSMLSNCDLTSSDFAKCNLERASLINCDLSRANFSGANLRYSDLTGISIRDTMFHNADLRGARVDNHWKHYLFQQRVLGYNTIRWITPESTRTP